MKTNALRLGKLNSFPTLIHSVLLIAIATIATSDVCLGGEPKSSTEVARIALDSFVSIITFDANRNPLGLGSGFFIKPDQIATNFHVIDGASFIIATSSEKNKTFNVIQIVATTKARDLAVLKVNQHNKSTLKLGNSDKAIVGQKIYALGSPEGLEGTFSEGMISSIRGGSSPDRLIQISAPISHGSSGGPILNTDAEVIGIAVAMWKDGQNLNFAVPVNYLRKLTGAKEKASITSSNPKNQFVSNDPLVPSSLEEKCNSGDGFSCNALGTAYQLANGVEKSAAQAAKYFAKACDDGVAAGCGNLANLYHSGNGVEKSEIKAADFYTKACDMGNAAACGNLGGDYALGLGTEKSYVKAAALLSKACDLGDPNGCSNLGALYEAGNGVEKSTSKAAKLITRACEMGDSCGCSNLGGLYESGEGVKRSDAKAAEYFARSCNGGCEYGCRNLGDSYRNGKGVEKSYSKAAEYYTKSCDEKSVAGCTGLGTLYESGNGVEKSAAKAAEYYAKGCDSENEQVSPYGCYNLGALYEKGNGIENSPQKARELYSKACNMGNGIACGKLGEFYEKGNGVEKSEVKAEEYFTKGCDGGAGYACKKLGAFYEKENGAEKASEIRIGSETVVTDHYFFIGFRQQAGKQIDVKSNTKIIRVGWHFGIKAKFKTSKKSIKSVIQLKVPNSPESFSSKKWKMTIQPDKNTVAVELEVDGSKGITGFQWGVGAGDPLGPYEMKLFVDDTLVGNYNFIVEEKSQQ